MLKMYAVYQSCMTSGHQSSANNLLAHDYNNYCNIKLLITVPSLLLCLLCTRHKIGKDRKELNEPFSTHLQMTVSCNLTREASNTNKTLTMLTMVMSHYVLCPIFIGYFFGRGELNSWNFKSLFKKNEYWNKSYRVSPGRALSLLTYILQCIKNYAITSKKCQM